MSHTFYDSPDDADPGISIDVTHDYCWFFQEGRANGVRTPQEIGAVIVRKEELPAIYRALGIYLDLIPGDAP